MSWGAVELTPSQRDLLHTLSQEDFTQYGEIYGENLDALIRLGLAMVHPGRQHQSGFIARGNGPMYRAVSLTDAGLAVANG